MVNIKDYLGKTESLPRGIAKLVDDDAGFEQVLLNRVNPSRFWPRAAGDSAYRLVAYRVVKEQDCKRKGDNLIFQVREWDGRKWYTYGFKVANKARNLEYRKGLWVFPERLRDFASVAQLGVVTRVWDFLEAVAEDHVFDYEIRGFTSSGSSIIR
jgi:hypothetical protein